MLCSLSLAGRAQDKTLKDQDALKDLSKKATELFAHGEIVKAIEALRPYWPLPKNEIDNVEEKSLTAMNLVTERFGKFIGTLKIKEQKIADIAFKEKYLIRLNNTAIRLTFIYYKSNDGWIVNSFKWDDNFIEEFE